MDVHHKKCSRCSEKIGMYASGRNWKVADEKKYGLCAKCYMKHSKPFRPKMRYGYGEVVL